MTLVHDTNSFFPSDLTASRVQFLEAAATVGARIQSYGLQPKCNDIAIVGALDSKKWLVLVSSSLSDSGVLAYALRDSEWQTKTQALGITMLYIHALTPEMFNLPDILSTFVPKDAAVSMLHLDGDENKNATPGEIISSARQSLFVEADSLV